MKPKKLTLIAVKGKKEKIYRLPKFNRDKLWSGIPRFKVDDKFVLSISCNIFFQYMAVRRFEWPRRRFINLICGFLRTGFLEVTYFYWMLSKSQSCVSAGLILQNTDVGFVVQYGIWVHSKIYAFIYLFFKVLCNYSWRSVNLLQPN